MLKNRPENKRARRALTDLESSRVRLAELEQSLVGVEAKRVAAEQALADAYLNSDPATIAKCRRAVESALDEAAGIGDAIFATRAAIEESAERESEQALEQEHARLTAAFTAHAKEAEPWLAQGAKLAAADLDLYEDLQVFSRKLERHRATYGALSLELERDDAMRMDASHLSGALMRARAVHAHQVQHRAWLGDAMTVAERKWQQEEEWRKSTPPRVPLAFREGDVVEGIHPVVHARYMH
jgi:hypothetical protein